MTRRVLVLGLAMVLSACGQPRVPQDSFYRLTEPGSVTYASSRLGGVLVVRHFLSDGLIRERPVVYASSASPAKLQQYNYHFWIESPARMLQDATVDYLRRAGVASTVATPEFRAPADYELTGKIKRFEVVRGGSPRAVISLEFGLHRVDDDRLMLLRAYDEDVALNGDDVAEAASAMSRAVGEVLAALVRDMGAL